MIMYGPESGCNPKGSIKEMIEHEQIYEREHLKEIIQGISTRSSDCASSKVTLSSTDEIQH
jgi:hypothetical protein